MNDHKQGLMMFLTPNHGCSISNKGFLTAATKNNNHR